MPQDNAAPRDKAELLARIDRSWAALLETVGRLGDAQLAAPRDAAGWAIKDHLAHLAAWERSIVYLLRGQPRHEGLGIDEATYWAGDMERDNVAIHERTRDLPPAAVLESLRDVHRQMLDAIAGLTDADLSKTYAQYLPDEPGDDKGTPIAEYIASDTYEHFDEHRGWIAALMA
ncbi:MAG TPA: ClbS/DfsB family four-helix bundle protein [Thermomicrobiales bacterium]|nr:ClbS/DfsB family four-helix bundle protein [Thermomicrobiales bacterium]